MLVLPAVPPNILKTRVSAKSLWLLQPTFTFTRPGLTDDEAASTLDHANQHVETDLVQIVIVPSQLACAA